MGLPPAAAHPVFYSEVAWLKMCERAPPPRMIEAPPKGFNPALPVSCPPPPPRLHPEQEGCGEHLCPGAGREVWQRGSLPHLGGCPALGTQPGESSAEGAAHLLSFLHVALA